MILKTLNNIMVVIIHLNESLVVCVRGIISFFTMLIFTRILGEQQLGELTFFDYILGITIGSFAASLTVDLSSAAWPHWVGLSTWVILGYIMQLISLKSKNISKYINDEPLIVIHNGMILGNNLKDSKFTLNELLCELRLKDVFDISKIKFGIIETNGELSVVSVEEFSNILNSMNIPEENRKFDNEVIFNGILINHNLHNLNIDCKWIENELKSQGIKSPTEVFYAYIDSSKKLKVDVYINKIVGNKNILK